MRALLFYALHTVGASSVSESACNKVTDCGSCVDRTVLGIHACYWCEIDVTCHNVGSLDSPCTPNEADDACISKSNLSPCQKRTTAACATNDAKKARQIHIALAGPAGMRIAWKTRGTISDSYVLLSTDPAGDVGKKFATGSSVQYLKDYGFHHVATLTGLSTGTKYYYRIVADNVTSTARTFQLIDKRSKMTVLVVGDMGYAELGQAVDSRKRMEVLKGSTDLTIHAGDVAYSDDSFIHPANLCTTEFCYEAVYDDYMEWIENVTDTKPYMVTPGNHESECHSPACLASDHLKESLGNFTAYNARWAMPSRESQGVSSMWYSFDYGPIHFVFINTETDFPDAASEKYGDCESCKIPAGKFAPSGAYSQWLQADLKAANANRDMHPWIVAVGHRPWLWMNGTDFDGAPGVKAAHAHLFEEYGVDMFLAGHIHAYHRMTPINGGMSTIVSGGAGCDEGFDNPRSKYMGPKVGTIDITNKTAFYDYRVFTLDHQIGTLEASTTSLIWKAIASSTGNIIDTVTVNKREQFTV